MSNVTQIPAWKASDGTSFVDHEEARAHEYRLGILAALKPALEGHQPAWATVNIPGEDLAAYITEIAIAIREPLVKALQSENGQPLPPPDRAPRPTDKHVKTD